MLSLLFFCVLVASADGVNKCGIDFASSDCGTLCPNGLNGECSAGETCFAGTLSCPHENVGCNNGIQGTCLQEVNCPFQVLPGQCNGPSNIQCCGAGNGCSVPTVGDGFCEEVSSCTGTSTSGFCPSDPPTVLCCTGSAAPTISPSVSSPVSLSPTTVGEESCTVVQTQGVCRDVSSCNGISTPGYCSGPSNVQCCTTPSGSSFLPTSPDISSSLGSCTTTYNGFVGECIDLSLCTGATFNDLCPGSSSVLCCVTETTSVTNVNGQFTLSQLQFEQLFTGISAIRAQAMRPYFNWALTKITIDSDSPFIACIRTAGLIAQLGHESVGLRYFEEIASGAAYEGRLDLGNTQVGDGPKFKGRGPIQLTGRANYASAGSYLGLDLETNPEDVCFPSVGFDAAYYYWETRNLNNHAGTDTEAAFIQLTLLINGGTNGLADRQARWAAAKNTLDCASASTTPFTIAPTTSLGSTQTPTTQQPTSASPTTKEPTTTTSEPTTKEPTSVSPTTAEPTASSAPSTLAPSDSPVTPAPSSPVINDGAGEIVMIAVSVAVAGLFGAISFILVIKRRNRASSKTVHYIVDTKQQQQQHTNYATPPGL